MLVISSSRQICIVTTFTWSLSTFYSYSPSPFSVLLPFLLIPFPSSFSEDDDDQDRSTGYSSSPFIPPYGPLTRSVSSMTAHSTAIPSLDPVSELDGVPDSTAPPDATLSPSQTDCITVRRSGSDGLSAGVYSSHNSPNIYKKLSIDPANTGADGPTHTPQSTTDLTACEQSRAQSTTWSVIKKVSNQSVPDAFQIERTTKREDTTV